MEKECYSCIVAEINKKNSFLLSYQSNNKQIRCWFTDKTWNQFKWSGEEDLRYCKYFVWKHDKVYHQYISASFEIVTSHGLHLLVSRHIFSSSGSFASNRLWHSWMLRNQCWLWFWALSCLVQRQVCVYISIMSKYWQNKIIFLELFCSICSSIISWG